MKDNSFQEHYLISNGMVHLGYRADSIDDIVCHYSAKGYETLSSEFLATFDEIVPHIPEKMPVALEISGCSFSEDEKSVIERTIWNHYHIKLSGIKQENKSTFIKMCWFTLSFILSGILLFLVDDNTENILVQYAYLPFWFFGYRVLIYLILDLIPQFKNLHTYEQLAGAKVFFSGISPINDVPVDKAEDYSAEFDSNVKNKEASDYDSMVNYYLIEEDGSAVISCVATGVDDVIRKTSVTGYEMLNTELEEYIDQQLPYIPEDGDTRLEFTGGEFSDDEEKTVLRAVTNYYAFRVENAKKEYRGSIHRIVWFLILMAAATVLLFCTEHTVDKATLEFITMIFWLIGDYLIEFVLLGFTEAKANLKRISRLAETEVQIK